MGFDVTAPKAAFALEAVRHAARMSRSIQAGMAGMNLTKGDLSPVTVGDFAVQAVVAHALDAAFPGAALVAEERSAQLEENAAVLETVTGFVKAMYPEAEPDAVCRWIDRGAAEPEGAFWTLDPIDGTKGYLRNGQYAVALAYLVDGVVQLGVLGCPGLAEGCVPEQGGGVLAIGLRGGGTQWAPLDNPGAPLRALRVSDRREAWQARLLRSFEAGHTNTGQIDTFVQRLGIAADPVPMDSQAKYAVLAAGHGELLLRLLSPKQPDYRERIWDHAAGSIIVEEAGGRVSDLDGRPLDFTQGRTLAANRGLLASNGALHDVALEALAELEKT